MKSAIGTECVNTEGTYWCACKEGYFRDTVNAQFSIGTDDRGNNIYIKVRAHRTTFHFFHLELLHSRIRLVSSD